MRLICDEMARLLERAPVNGVSHLAWEVATVLARYDQQKRNEIPSIRPSGQAPLAPEPNRGRSRLSSDDDGEPSDADMDAYGVQAANARHAARRAEP